MSGQAAHPKNAKAAAAALSILLALPAAARGQGFGLDLSDGDPAAKPAEAPAAPAAAPAASLGLDLSSEVDYRPSFAFLGLSVVREDGSAPSNAERQRFARLAEVMMAGARLTGHFSSLLEPSEVAAKLGERAAQVPDCKAKGCLDELAHALGVERVANAQVTIGKRGPRMAIWSWARAGAEAQETAVLASGSGFEKQVGTTWRGLLDGLSAHLGKLVVTSNLPGAAIKLGDRPLGNGSFEAFVPAGTHTLEASESESLPFSKQVEVAPDAEVQAGVELLPRQVVDPEIAVASLVPARSGSGMPAILREPGLYVGAAGVALLAAGAGLGLSAKAIEGRGADADGDGVRDITRVEMQSARTRAMLANVLLGVGSAALAGGVVWVLIEPTGAPLPSESGASIDAPRATGWSVSAGGIF